MKMKYKKQLESKGQTLTPLEKLRAYVLSRGVGSIKALSR